MKRLFWLTLAVATFFAVMDYKTSKLLDEALAMLKTQQKAVVNLCMYVDPTKAPVEINEACIEILENAEADAP